jgi:hypothetical protein
MTRNSFWPTLAGLTLLILLGGFLRLYHLGDRSVTHVEMYVPGIRLPHGISYPEERLTLLKVATSTLNSDTHPPAFYLLMWYWTKLFGTSTWAMRLPSALLGTACIPMVFWLGSLTRQTTAGWIAAALVAVNGHLIFWSQIARMFTFACCLGLLATILLLKLAQQTNPSRTLHLLYVTVMLLGLCTHIFFWLILAAHMLWTLATAWSERLPLPGAAKVQFLVLILGSPLLASSAYQNGNTLATLSSSVLVYAREYLQFGFVFPLMEYSSGVFPDRGPIPTADDPHLSLVRWLFFLLCLVLFVIGASFIRASANKLLTDTSGPSYKGWLLAAVLAALAILFFVFIAKTYAKPPNPTLRTSEAMIILPFLFALAAVVVQRSRSSLVTLRPSSSKSESFVSGHDFQSCRHSTPDTTALAAGTGVKAHKVPEPSAARLKPCPDTNLFPKRSLAGGQILVLTLAVVPFAMLAVISLFKPIFNARGLIIVVPYLLLLLAAGIVRLFRYPVLAAAVLLAIAVADYSGLRAYSHVSAGRADYKAFAAALVPQIESTDLVFLTPEFFSTPLFYYLSSDWDHIVGRNYDTASCGHSQARIWALWFSNYEPHLSPTMARALTNYHVLRTIEVPGAQASLYVPNNRRADQVVH